MSPGLSILTQGEPDDWHILLKTQKIIQTLDEQVPQQSQTLKTLSDISYAQKDKYV